MPLFGHMGDRLRLPQPSSLEGPRGSRLRDPSSSSIEGPPVTRLESPPLLVLTEDAGAGGLMTRGEESVAWRIGAVGSAAISAGLTCLSEAGTFQYI